MLYMLTSRDLGTEMFQTSAPLHKKKGTVPFVDPVTQKSPWKTCLIPKP